MAGKRDQFTAYRHHREDTVDMVSWPDPGSVYGMYSLSRIVVAYEIARYPPSHVNHVGGAPWLTEETPYPAY